LTISGVCMFGLLHNIWSRPSNTEISTAAPEHAELAHKREEGTADFLTLSSSDKVHSDSDNSADSDFVSATEDVPNEGAVQIRGRITAASVVPLTPIAEGLTGVGITEVRVVASNDGVPRYSQPAGRRRVSIEPVVEARTGSAEEAIMATPIPAVVISAQSIQQTLVRTTEEPEVDRITGRHRIVQKPKENQIDKEKFIEGMGYFKSNLYDQAMTHFQAIHNFPMADFLIGFMHHNGLGVTADIEQALVFYRRAASNNCLEAQLFQARLEEKSLKNKIRIRRRSTQQDIITLYESVTSNQSVQPFSESIYYAFYRLGRVYGTGNDTALTDPDKAMQYYDMAIQGYQHHAPHSIGHAKALYHKGMMLISSSSYKEAEKCLRVAADLGLKEAETNILLSRAKESFDNENFADVIRICSTGLNVDPNSAELMFYKAASLYKTTEIKYGPQAQEALTLIRQALILAPSPNPNKTKYIELKELLFSHVIENINAKLAEALRNEHPLLKTATQAHEGNRRGSGNTSSPFSFLHNMISPRPTPPRLQNAPKSGENTPHTPGSASSLSGTLGAFKTIELSLGKILRGIDWTTNKLTLSHSAGLARKFADALYSDDAMSWLRVIIGGANNDGDVATSRKDAGELLDELLINTLKSWIEVKERQVETPAMHLDISQFRLLNKKKMFADNFRKYFMDLYLISVLVADRKVDPIVDECFAEKAINTVHYLASPFAALMGAFGPLAMIGSNVGVAVSAASGAMQATAEAIHKVRTDMIRTAAEVVARLEHRDVQAMNTVIEEVAKELSHRYVIQLYNVVDEDISTLAKCLVDKIINHITSQNSVFNKVKRSPVVLLQSALDSILGDHREPDVPDTKSLIMEGVIKGQSQNRRDPDSQTSTYIKTEMQIGDYGENWFASGIFDQVGITNGRTIWGKTSGMDPGKYGGKIGTSIEAETLGYVHTELPRPLVSHIRATYELYESSISIEEGRTSQGQHARLKVPGTTLNRAPSLWGTMRSPERQVNTQLNDLNMRSAYVKTKNMLEKKRRFWSVICTFALALIEAGFMVCITPFLRHIPQDEDDKIFPAAGLALFVGAVALICGYKKYREKNRQLDAHVASGPDNNISSANEPFAHPLIADLGDSMAMLEAANEVKNTYSRKAIPNPYSDMYGDNRMVVTPNGSLLTSSPVRFGSPMVSLTGRRDMTDAQWDIAPPPSTGRMRVA
jgi:TPR repeat protein